MSVAKKLFKEKQIKPSGEDSAEILDESLLSPPDKGHAKRISKMEPEPSLKKKETVTR